MKHYLVAALAFLMLSAPVCAAGDTELGKKVFRKCAACHTVVPGKKKPGPHLAGIVGRKAGSVDGFRYSKAMQGSGIVWDETALSGFLKAPKKYLKGTKMAFPGIKKDTDLANLLAYLNGL